MGLPELTFTLTRAAQTTAARVSSGIVAMILRDTKAHGLHTIHRESDIPADLSVANTAAVKLAMVGYINKPDRVYVCVIDAEDDIEVGFSALLQHSYDYLVGPMDISAEDATKLADLVKSWRNKRYIGKAVLPETAADNEGVVNFTANGIAANVETSTSAQYAARVAGMLAGTPAACSATYGALPEVTSVDTMEDPDAAVDAGKLFLLDDGRQVKLSRAVTSKVTLGATEPPALKKVKLVAALDLIRYYTMSAVEDDYLGKCANTYDNKCILLTALRGYLDTLESRGVLQSGSYGVSLDAAAIRAYLIQKAESEGNTDEATRIRGLEDEALRKEDTGSHVFIAMHGRLLDAMEDFHIALEVQ